MSGQKDNPGGDVGEILMLLNRGEREVAPTTGSTSASRSSDSMQEAEGQTAIESEEAQERKRPRHTTSIPRILKNDIRRHYCKMFLNTINSADVFNMQDFFNTFMTGSCKFIADQKFTPDLGFPDRLSTHGPRLAAHYVLGVFLMLPDLVIKLLDSQIITSNSWSGSKIQLQVQVTFTKVCDIPMGAWIPSQQFLDKVYQQNNMKSVLQVAELARQATAASSSSAAARDSSGETADLYTPLDESAEQTSTRMTTESNDNDDSGPGSVHEYCLQAGINKQGGAENLNSPAFAQAYIPYSYIRTLSTEATPLPQPLSVQNTGTITFYLDSNNHIQHMYMNLSPK